MLGPVVGVIALMLWSCAPQQPWQQVPLTATGYDNEAQDFGIAPTSAIRTSNYDAPTPTAINGAKVVSTAQLRDMMIQTPAPLVIDVLGGNQTISLPGAIWLKDAGLGSRLDDGTQAKLGAFLAARTHGDKAAPIVFFCLSRVCWLSHNAAVRAVALGYSNVSWYRGGRDAWKAAGLPLVAVERTPF